MDINDQSVPVTRLDGSDLSGPILRPEIGGVLDPPPAPVRPIHDVEEVTPPAVDVEDLRKQEKKSS